MDSAEASTDADAGGGEATAPARFTEDLILEIMFHLPARSLYRFKCVSRQWLGLITDLNHRSRMSQTLAGFFYIGYNLRQRPVRNTLHFTSARPDEDDGPPPLIDPPALSLPPAACINLHRVDCSNGLILLRRWNATPEDGFSLTVCNPATDEWAAVPDSPTRGVGSHVRLAVDPAAVSPFRYFVFEFRSDLFASGCVTSAAIYSSESGEWTYRALRWEDDVEAGVSLRDETSGVFFGGMLHLAPLEPVIVSVDGGGNTWKTIPKPMHPDDDYFGVQAPGFIGVSQGRLHFLNTREYDHLTLCDWEQDDDGGWVMKHRVSLRELFAGRWDFEFGEEMLKYSVIAIHPDGNIVYLLQKQNNTLLSYGLTSGEGCVIRDLGLDNFVPYLPYVPRFSIGAFSDQRA